MKFTLPTLGSLLLGLGLLVQSLPLFAVSTDSVRDDSFDSFQQGELENVALTSDGYLYPTYARKSIGDTGAEIVWSVLSQGADRGFLCATGHDGKLVRFKSPGADPQVLADLPEPELTAMIALDDGSALIAAAPSARIYRLDPNDKLTSLTLLDAKFVWDMELDSRGDVWAATGDDGKLFHINLRKADPEVTTAHAFPSKNIIDVWIDHDGAMGPKGDIYLAGQSPAWLYRFRPSDQSVAVVYSAAADEIRALQITPDGLALATNTERSPSPQALNLTLRMAGGSPAPPAASSPDSQSSASSSSSPSSGSSSESRSMGDAFSASAKSAPFAPSSAVVLLSPEGFARTLWNSPERPIHALALAPSGNLLVAAGGKGRLFEILPHDAFSVVADLKEDYIVRIVPSHSSVPSSSFVPPQSWLLASARNGLLQSMDPRPAPRAVYRSRVIDARTPVRWGQFYCFADPPPASAPKPSASPDPDSLLLSFRRGATDDPEDGFWEPWSSPQPLSADRSVPLPPSPARFLQYQITFNSPAPPSPSPLTSSHVRLPSPAVDSVEAFFAQPNRPPRVRKITVSDPSARPASSGGGSSSPSSEESSDSSAKSSSSSSSSAADSPPRGPASPSRNPQSLTISWSADDPNADSLLFSLFYKASDESDWKLIDDDLRSTRVPLGVAAVGDGRYRFKVLASDRLANPPGFDLSAFLISDEVLIDNSPPVISNLSATPSGSSVRLAFTVSDSLSLIASVSIDIDGADPFPIPPSDSFFDQSNESFLWTSPALSNGEHVATIFASDRRANSSVQRIVFRIGN